MTRSLLSRIEASPVVLHVQMQSIPLLPQYDYRVSRAGVPSDVIHPLLENQKQLTARIRSKVPVRCRFGGVEFQQDPPGGERFAGEPAHALRQIVQPVVAGIECPDDFTERFQHVARHRGYLPKRGRLRGYLLTGHLAHDRHLRKAGAHIIVKVGGNAAAQALQLQRDAVLTSTAGI